MTKFAVKMPSHSGATIYAAADGHPADWVTLNNPPPPAYFTTRQEANQHAARVLALGYATPSVVEVPA